MGRRARYLPDDEHLVEVTCRVIQRRFLLRPSSTLRSIIIGTLARYQKRHRMRICGFVYLSNHCHLLLRPESVEQMAAFMRDINSKIAREAGRLYGWRDKFWSRRYTSIVVSVESEDQVARLRYLLEQGCKEGLVASPREWPGATSIEGLLSGKALEGVWIDRTGPWRSRAGSSRLLGGDATTQQLQLSPIPCWDGLSERTRRARASEMVREIERRMRDVVVLGAETICRQDPHGRPREPERRRTAPMFHAVAPQIRRALEAGYRHMRAAYLQAREQWRSGRPAEFPPGCFAPGRFVPLRL